jgi:hypothetical protein
MNLYKLLLTNFYSNTPTPYLMMLYIYNFFFLIKKKIIRVVDIDKVKEHKW